MSYVPANKLFVLRRPCVLPPLPSPATKQTYSFGATLNELAVCVLWPDLESVTFELRKEVLVTVVFLNRLTFNNWAEEFTPNPTVEVVKPTFRVEVDTTTATDVVATPVLVNAAYRAVEVVPNGLKTQASVVVASAKDPDEANTELLPRVEVPVLVIPPVK